MSQPGEQTIAICISSSKENQVMKFGQVIEYTMRNLLLEDSYTKCGGETIPRPFSRKSKYISGSIVLSFMRFVFIVC